MVVSGRRWRGWSRTLFTKLALAQGPGVFYPGVSKLGREVLRECLKAKEWEMHRTPFRNACVQAVVTRS